MPHPKVVVTKIDRDGHRPAMKRLFSHLSLPSTADRVAIKLNLCDYRRPETGAVSHPAVVHALLGELRELFPRAELLLCENDASDTLVENMYRYLGLDAVAAAHGATCVNLSGDQWVRVPIKGLRFTEVEVPATLVESDLLINHPKLKTHGKTKMTCGLKNLFGCYRPKDKRPYHRFLDDAIVDINLAVRPVLTLVDADLCVEGNRGPTQGLPKRVGLFIGGQDVVAVDAFCARLMGFWPSRVAHVRKAARAGIGSLRYDLQGDFSPAEFRQHRFRYSRAKFLLMQVSRRILAWSDVG